LLGAHAGTSSRGARAHAQITETGQTGTILTFYELTEGDLASQTEFRELHPALLRRAVEGLVKRGKAQIIKGAEGDGDGVRFF
jgi:ESCRT-II complex subunit VPS25